MAWQEELKLYPFGDIWDRFCEIHDVPIKQDWIKAVKTYEKDVLAKRG